MTACTVRPLKFWVPELYTVRSRYGLVGSFAPLVGPSGSHAPVPPAGRAFMPNQSLRAVANAEKGAGPSPWPSVLCSSQSCSAKPLGLSSREAAPPGENVAIAAILCASSGGTSSPPSLTAGLGVVAARGVAHAARTRGITSTATPTDQPSNLCLIFPSLLGVGGRRVQRFL